MKNVYEQVKIFYSANESWEPVIEKEWVEGFLRQKAWAGTGDEILKETWYQLQLFIVYLAHSEIYDLSEVSKKEYSLAVQWLSTHIPDFKMSIKQVRGFFDTLVEFYQYLLSKKLIDNMDELYEAAKEIAGGKKVKLDVPTDLLTQMRLLGEAKERQIAHFSDDATDLSRYISEAIESLMFKLGKYFQQEEFRHDFDRALYLYTGPFDTVPEDQEDEFWLGFWDYFLFDYHLCVSDQTPLEYFHIQNGHRLREDELQILKDLLTSKFTIFYINKIISQDTVQCINLFTGETFDLPYPDLEYKTMKRLLFFGHVFSKGLLMINYVTSIEISAKLRQRIKDEVYRQKEIFAIQAPDASIDAFFSRHSLAVRHTINILVTLAKVNVTSTAQLERMFPKIEEKNPPNSEVLSLLYKLAFDQGFSLHDIILMHTMWYDYSQLVAVRVRKSAVWAAAVLLAFSQVNCIHNLNIEAVAEDLAVSSSSVCRNRNKLFKVLQLEKFDARYISEEGFVISLFMP